MLIFRGNLRYSQDFPRLRFCGGAFVACIFSFRNSIHSIVVALRVQGVDDLKLEFSGSCSDHPARLVGGLASNVFKRGILTPFGVERGPQHACVKRL